MLLREYDIDEHITKSNPNKQDDIVKGLKIINKDISDIDDNNTYKIMIPRAHARMETSIKPKLDELESVEHYSIYIVKQIGSIQNRRDTILFCNFPSSDRLFKVILHTDGGVSFEKSEHKYMLRVTDELDRRIILGYCMMYQVELRWLSYGDKKPMWRDYSNALNYRADMMAKRLKHGPINTSIIKYNNLKAFEENANIFSKVVLI